MRYTFFSAAVALGLTACSFAPAPSHPRPPLPSPLDIAATPISTPSLTRLESESRYRWHGTICGEGEEVQFELWSERDVARVRPLVLLVPILAGGSALMDFVADGMYARGFDVAYCERVGSAMTAGQRGSDLQELLRRTVLHQRLLLTWLREVDDEQPRPQFVLGISLGGMIATTVAAHEPQVAGVAICLSGGDLQSLVITSGEPRVRRWVDWRLKADGIGLDYLQWELRDQVHFEPIATASAIATDKVLFVSAYFDDVVPQQNQDLLWEALGRPARLTVPLGHYSAALAIAPILSAAAVHFTARIPVRSSTGNLARQPAKTNREGLRALRVGDMPGFIVRPTSSPNSL